MSISAVGLPKSLSSEVDYQLPPGVSSYPVRVVPSNVSKVDSGSLTLALTADKIQNLGFNATNVIFDVPAGQSKSVHIDPRFSTLSFRATYTVSTAGTTGSTSAAYLRSNCMSFFDRTFTESQSGVVCDDVNQLGLVADTLLQLETDIAQRDCLAQMYGLLVEDAGASSQNNNQGHSIPTFVGGLTANATSSYSYTVPLINSLIGRDAVKMFNIGATNKLRLTFTTTNTLPITIVNSATAFTGTAPVITVVLDNFQLNLQYIDVGPEGLKLLNKTGLQYYNSVTYRVSSSTIPAGSSTAVSILTGLKGSSVRGIISRFSESVAPALTACVNERYDSKMPQATSITYNVNGVRVPSNPLDLIHNPSLAFACLQECNSAFSPYQMKSSIIPQRYCVYVPGGTIASDADYWVKQSSASSEKSLSSFMFGYNLEKVSREGILDGMNLNSGQTFLEMNLSNSNTNTLTAYFIAKQDIIHILDPATGELSVRM